MRSRVFYGAALVSLSTLALPLAAHAATAIPFFGPIIPPELNCPLGFAGVLTVVNNIIKFAITFLIVFAAPLMIAYAGFLFVINPINAEGKSKARNLLMNVVIGIVVMLLAYPIVAAVMAVLYKPSEPAKAWNTIISGGTLPVCLSISSALNPLQPTQPTTPSTPTGPALGGPAAQCAPGNTACSVTALKAAGFNDVGANVMSCVAMTENSGNAAGCNGNACGTFQIVITLNKLTGPDCARFNGGNPVLDCPAMCHGNNGAAVKTTACGPCVQAASDAKCNAESAASMYAAQGVGPWVPPASDNKKSPACVTKYGGALVS